jgi:chromate transport protein ChrA
MNTNLRQIATVHGGVIGVVAMIIVPATMFGYLPEAINPLHHPARVVALMYGVAGASLAVAAQAITVLPALRRKVKEIDEVTWHYCATQCVAVAFAALAVMQW